MSALGAEVVGARVLDLFAGSGALGLEALSRGADQVVFVERSRGALRVLHENIDRLDAGEETRVVADDVFRFLKRVDDPYDIALADPPYGSGDAGRLLDRFGEVPFARQLWLEHPVREALPLPPSARTRRYGDTALSCIQAEP
jgi:16S rRNA (guanine966-N2)-methyltransferase